MMTLNEMIAAAEAQADELHAITRGDGSTYQGRRNRATVECGNVQVYLVPVDQRTRRMKSHYRATFYLLVDGHYKRVSRKACEAEIAEQEINAYIREQTDDEGKPLNPDFRRMPQGE